MVTSLGSNSWRVRDALDPGAADPVQKLMGSLRTLKEHQVLKLNLN